MHKNWVLTLGAPPQRQTCEFYVKDKLELQALRHFFSYIFSKVAALSSVMVWYTGEIIIC